MGDVLSKYSCHYFFLEWYFSLFDFLSTKTFFIRGITRYYNCQEKNVDCVMLARTGNKVSVLLEMFSTYLATVTLQ